MRPPRRCPRCGRYRMKQYHGNSMTWWECDCGYTEGLEGKANQQRRVLGELASDIHGYGRSSEELDDVGDNEQII